ncbi:TPA: ANR family transcriptional regulator [Pasteurella multocida]|nr:ANR family transcriptional regulator [Pasteurella multocida]HDR1913180.1 ANR family transcriptional regulator [Pasteurella multocida]
MAKKANNLSFKELANLAREVERAGDYSYAAEVWRKAAQLAKKAINKEWCLYRHAFLTKWGARWGENENG